MKLYKLLSFFVLISCAFETKGDCDASEAIKCSSDYKTALKKVGNDQHKYCVSIHGYLDCLEGNDCLTQDNKDQVSKAFHAVGIKCGATSLSVSLAIISATLCVTVKNIL